MLPSDRLRTLAVFAEDPNLSRAARVLGLSQPAVHAQLKALAEDVGVALYQRQGRSLVLTRAGAEVAAIARSIDETTVELVARLRGEETSQPVVLAAGAGALVHLLAGGLRRFSRAGTAPIEVTTCDAAQAVELVRRGLAHVGVGVLDAPPAGLEAHVLARAAQVVVVPRGHRLAARRRVSLADVATEPLVLPPEGGPQRRALDAALAGTRPRVAAAVRGWDVVLKLVEAGVGIGIVNATCALPRSLVARPVHDLARVTYYALTRPKPSPRAHALVEAFLATITNV